MQHQKSNKNQKQNIEQCHFYAIAFKYFFERFLFEPESLDTVLANV